MIALMGFIILLVLIIILFLLFVRLYIMLDWEIEPDKCHILISLSVLYFPILKEKIDITKISALENHLSLPNSSPISSFKKILSKMRFEDSVFDLFIGTGNPIYTAYLYPFLQTFESIDAEKFHISIDFQNKRLQSVGQCMISIKLCHTKKVIGIIKQFRRKGD